MVRRIGLLTLGAAVGLTLSACSDDHGPDGDAEPPSTSPTGGVTVIAEDIALDEPTYRAQAGAVDITYRNEGNIEHTLVIEGVDGFKLDVPANGDVDQASVDLQPGQYTLYCDIPGHRVAGMEATLDVAGQG
jgi:plastocyanin